MTYTAAGSFVTNGYLIGNHRLNRRKHIIIARELSRDLQTAATEFDRSDVSGVEPSRLWESMQPPADIKERLTEFLDDLYFDGVRSRFFGEFDADKLILPVASDIARRLEMLADDLERQLGPPPDNLDDQPSL